MSARRRSVDGVPRDGGWIALPPGSRRKRLR